MGTFQKLIKFFVSSQQSQLRSAAKYSNRSATAWFSFCTKFKLFRTRRNKTFLHTHTHCVCLKILVGLCLYAWMLLFSFSALIISSDQHDWLLFPLHLSTPTPHTHTLGEVSDYLRWISGIMFVQFVCCSDSRWRPNIWMISASLSLSSEGSTDISAWVLDVCGSCCGHSRTHLTVLYLAD